MATPERFSFHTLWWVMSGAAIGVALRALLTLSFPGAAAWNTVAINIVGSLLLGMLVGSVGTGHPRIRAFAGTGLLGGFTTYSAFAVHVGTDFAILLDHGFTGNAGRGVVIAVATIAGGLAAAALGLRLGATFVRVGARLRTRGGGAR